MKRKEYLYEFTFKGYGWGTDEEKAWKACQENFLIEEEDLPEYEIVDTLEEEDI